MTHCCRRWGLSVFFLASARSCCRWPAQRCSAPRRSLPEAVASISRVPLGAPNRPGQPASPRLLHQRCVFWRRLANACRSAQHRRPLPPAAGAPEQLCRRWSPGLRQFGCHSRLRRRPTHPPSAECALSSCCRAGCLPLVISAVSRPRSSSLSFTTYFFTAISLAATNRLRWSYAERSSQTSTAKSRTPGTMRNDRVRHPPQSQGRRALAGRGHAPGARGTASSAAGTSRNA